MSSARRPILEFSAVDRSFARPGTRLPALTNITLALRERDFVAVVGPSGSGKSTLLDLAAGLLRPDRGVVRYDGMPVVRVNTAVGYVSQRDDLLPWRTVRDNIALPLEIRGIPRSERRELVEEQIGVIGLHGFADHFPSQLSAGMRKRVSLARTLVYRPRTLLMDEPFADLDAQLRVLMHAELLRLWEGTDLTVLFVTHDLMEAIVLADRVIVLSARPGRIRLEQQVDLPRPRPVARFGTHARFGELHDVLWAEIKDDAARGIAAT